MKERYGSSWKQYFSFLYIFWERKFCSQRIFQNSEDVFWVLQARVILQGRWKGLFWKTVFFPKLVPVIFGAPSMVSDIAWEIFLASDAVISVLWE